jgi:hypothetical protein
MIIMIKKIIYVFLGALILSGCSSTLSQKNLYNQKSKIEISKEQLSRLGDYLKGNFYDYSANQKNQGAPMFFLLNEKGDKSVLIACQNPIDTSYCDLGVGLYQAVMRFNHKYNDSFFIIAKENKIILSGQKITANKNTIKPSENEHFILIKSASNKFHEIVVDEKKGEPDRILIN